MNRIKSIWRMLKNWVMPAFGIILFVIIINQISWKELLNVISNVDLLYLVPALIFGISTTVLKTIRYGYFFPAPGRWVNLYGTFAFSRLMYYVLPFNTGEVAYLSLLKKHKFSPTIAETVPTWIFLRITDVIALGLWTILALIIIPSHGILYEKMHSFRWLFVGVIAVFVIILLTLPYWISFISFKSANGWFSERLAALKSGFSKTLGIRAFFRSLAIAMVIWAAIIASDVFTQLTFNTPLQLPECLIAAITILSLTLLPINPPMNLGTGDVAWAGVMIIAGVSTTFAISFAISIRIIGMIIILADGLIGYSILLFYQHLLISKKNKENKIISQC